MRKENIIEMIDKRILDNLSTGYSVDFIIGDIKEKNSKMLEVITSQNLDFDKLADIDFDVLSGADFSDAKVSVTRTKYTVFYIKHSRKRIDDLLWIQKNKHKFSQLSRSQVFKLIKLKEKLMTKSDLPF